jgi:hypothetical protein
MKKTILISAMILFCFYVKSQDIKSDSTKFTYCELVGTARLLSNKVTVEIDFGQATKFFSDRRYKDQSTGKPVVFNSMVDALNFMGKDRWEFVQAYIVTIGSSTSSQNIYHFLLKKQTSLLEQEK